VAATLSSTQGKGSNDPDVGLKTYTGKTKNIAEIFEKGPKMCRGEIMNIVGFGKDT
jgi:hypothetical protein